MIDQLMGFVFEKQIQESARIRSQAISLTKRWLEIMDHVKSCPNCYMKLEDCSTPHLDNLIAEAKSILSANDESKN